MWRIIYLILLFVCVRYYHQFILKRLNTRLKILAEQNNPELFLQKMDSDIKWTIGGQHRNMLRLQKTNVHSVQGDYQALIEALHKINPRKLPDYSRIMYLNSLIFAYLQIGRLEEAEKLVEENRLIFEMEYPPSVLKHQIFHTLAVFEFCRGNLVESRRILEEMLGECTEKDNDSGMTAWIQFDLAQIELREGRIEQAVELLHRAMMGAKREHLRSRIAEMLNSLATQF